MLEFVVFLSQISLSLYLQCEQFLQFACILLKKCCALLIPVASHRIHQFFAAACQSVHRVVYQVAELFLGHIISGHKGSKLLSAVGLFVVECEEHVDEGCLFLSYNIEETRTKRFKRYFAALAVRPALLNLLSLRHDGFLGVRLVGQNLLGHLVQARE